MKVSRFAKAVVTSIGGLAMVLTAAFADDVFSVGEMTEVGAVLVEAAVTVWAVYKIQNATAEPARPPE